MTLPLEGITILDLTRFLPAALGTMILADMGADVIRVETPEPSAKNLSRLMISVKAENEERRRAFDGRFRNKRSIAINLKDDRGKAVFYKIVQKADVVAIDFRPVIAKQLGVDYDSLKKIKPDIIYISSSGVGRTGPGKNYLAYGTLLQGLSGWTSLFSEPNPRMEGMGIVPSWTDPLTGLWEALLIQAALLHRSRTGEGFYVDLSMLESTITIMGDVFLGVAATGKPPVAGRSSSHSHVVPHGIYPCKGTDSWIAISVEGVSLWESFCRVLGDPSWCHEADMLTLADRQQSRARIDRLVADWTSGQQAQELFHRLQAARVPAGPCYNFREVVEDPQMQLRGLYRTLPGRDGREQRTTGIPWKDDTEWKGNLTPAPALGEHNEYVFLELLGMSRQAYEDFRQSGIIE